MNNSPLSLIEVFEGWDGYQQSIVLAIRNLTSRQLSWRPAEGLRSTGEIARHIALGRIDWFLRMEAPGSKELASQINAWTEDAHGNRYVIQSEVVASDQATGLVYWLESTWKMIENTLKTWTVADLMETYRHTWRGDEYLISRQWTLWRIMAHDIHHGGELALTLGMQGIKSFELGDLGGHIISPRLLE